MENKIQNIDLDKVREEINKVDNEIVRKFERRFELVELVGKYKEKKNLPIYDEDREKKVIEECVNILENPKYISYIEELYIDIMNISKKLQENEVFQCNK